MKSILTTILILLSTLSSFAQSSYPFTRSDTISLNAVSKWVNIPGQSDASASIGVSSNQGIPQHTLGNGQWGGIYWDSTLVPPWEAKIVLKQLPGTRSTSGANLYFGAFTGTSPSFATGNGWCQMFTFDTGLDYFNLRYFQQYATITNGGSGLQPTDVTVGRSEYLANDTLIFRAYADGRKTTIRKRGSTYDSLSSTQAVYSLTTSAKVFLYGFTSATPILIDDFSIGAIGATPPPPGGSDTVAPVAVSLTRNTASAYTGGVGYATFSATDDSSINQMIVEVDTGAGYYTLSTYTASGAVLSYSLQSSTFTKYAAGTATLRGRVSDHRGRYDTSSTTTIAFSAAPASSAFNKKVYGYLPWTGSIRWTGTSTGTIPADSIPWDVLTHAVIFASDGATPIPPGYLYEASKLPTEAHSRGVFAGYAYGGSGDAGLQTMISTPSSHLAWINYNLNLIDTYGLDFIEFDLEGTFALANVTTLFSRFYDSLQTRNSANDPTRRPFIVLTVGPSRAASWVSLAPYVEFVALMSYDYIGTWWCRLIHDASVTSRTNYDGTGAVTDFYSCGVNSEAPSMQLGALKVSEAGWAKSKIVVGFDANPTYYYSTSTTGRGPLYIRQPVSGISGLNYAGSNPDFNTQWATLSAIPSDSIIFDPIGKAYWAHTGTTASNDRVWTMLTLPGRDSGVAATRKLVDSMNIGGVMIWNLTTEIWSTPASNIPPGGRGWFYSQLRTHFSGQDTTISTLNPPTTFSPANNATGVLTTATFDWNDVSGVNASAGYNVQIDNNQDFSSTIKDTSVTPSQYVLTSSSLSNGTTYYGRVRVKNAANVWGGWSSTIAFTTIPAVPGTPTLTSPADAVTGQSQTLTFQWAAASGSPTHYQLLVDDDVGFGSAFLSDSTITGLSRQVPGFANSQLYYWKVRAKSYAGGWGSYSSTRTFTTGSGVPAIPNLLSPSNGASNQSVTPTFTWTRPAGADSFQFQIDSTADFTTPLKDTLTASASYANLTLVSGLTYYWKVLSNGTAGNSQYSGAFSLTIGIDIQPPAPGQLGYYVLMFNPASLKWEGKLLQIIESQNLALADYPKPLDSNGITWGPKGYKSFDGSTVSYVTGAGGGLTASQILDSLQTLTLDSLTLQSPIVKSSIVVRDDVDSNNSTTIIPSHGNRSITTALPSYDGSIGVKDNVSENYSIGSIALGQRLAGTYGGTNIEGQGASGYALFKEGPNDTVKIRAITTGDVVGYSSGSPTGKTVVDSLNTNGRNDTITTGLTFQNDTLWFVNSSTVRGHIYASSTALTINGASASSGGVLLNDGNSGSKLQISGTDNGALFVTAAAQNNDHFEVMHRGQMSVRTDSAFQVSDSTTKAIFQVSSWGEIVGRNNYLTGTDAYTTTATTDTVTVTGAATTDRYFITLTGSAAPSANDAFRVQSTATGFVIHRSASGTSGLTYDWFRVRVIP